MKVKSLISLFLALILCLAPVGAYAAEGEDAPAMPELGDPMPDFTFTTYDGTEYTLSEVLQEKDMVLINIWATWCGPCQMEFPFMEEAYEQYKDQIEIFALSCEPEDTDDVLADYVAEMGMTFPVGRDTPGLADLFLVNAIPTTIIVDRLGNVCFVESGSQSSTESFTGLFDIFLGDDYSESILLDGMPKTAPTVEPTDEAALAEALGVSEGVAVANPEDEYSWPMAVGSDDSRSYVTSSNAGVGNSVSALDVLVQSAGDDTLALEYKLSTESGYDYMTIAVDGEAVKSVSGERDWTTFAYTFDTAGEHTVSLSYEKDETSDEGDDAVWFSNVRLVSGDEAAEVLASLPVYPHGEQTAITIANESAKEIVFDDPLGVFDGMGEVTCFIVPDEEVEFSMMLAEGVDPDSASVMSYYDYSAAALSECVDGEGYTFTSGIDTMDTTGYPYTYVVLTDSPDDPGQCVFFFADEENANAFLSQYFIDENGEPAGSWQYADGAAPATDAVAGSESDVPDGYSSYILSFLDTQGHPVEGVIANVCDDETCTPMTSDENGLIEFVYPSFAYHIQVIKVPEGYAYDTAKEDYLSENGGTTLFVLIKQ